MENKVFLKIILRKPRIFSTTVLFKTMQVIIINLVLLLI